MGEFIQLPNINEWKQKIDGICWRINKLTFGQQVTLDMEKITFLRPQGAIMLLLICNRIWDLTGKEVNLIKIDQSVHAYLERVNFFEISYAYTDNKLLLWNRLNRSVESQTVMEITHVKTPIDSAKIKTRVGDILENWFPERRKTKFCSEVATMVTEICNNSLEHSKGHNEMGECYCMLQKYSILGKPEIAIAVGDIGVGIRHHLKLTHKWVQDSDVLSIKKVISGLSGREDGSGGMGIPFIKNTISSYNGSFAIRSGKGIVEVHESVIASEFQNSFPGTQTLLILD